MIRFEIQYKEADVDCFKDFNSCEEWSCFINAETNHRTCKRLVENYLKVKC
jgi:hypothetical protein